MGQTFRKMLAALSPWTSANSQQTAETRQYRAIMSDAALSKFLAVFYDHDGRPGFGAALLLVAMQERVFHAASKKRGCAARADRDSIHRLSVIDARPAH
jgi:hypothetical protein